MAKPKLSPLLPTQTALSAVKGSSPHMLFLAACMAGKLPLPVLMDTLLTRGKNPQNWAAWRAFLCAISAQPMSPVEAQVYATSTQRQSPPSAQVREAWMAVGRRGGKSRVAALIAIWAAFAQDYSKILAPGQRGYVTVLSRSQKEAREVIAYVKGMLSGALAPLMSRVLEDSIELNHVPITIEVGTASWRAVRARTIVAAICDEIAFWRSDESANPDVEVLRALRPGMATVPNSVLIGLSSPYARRGVLWDACAKYYGKEAKSDSDKVLFWKAPTWVMHPPDATLKLVIEEEFAKDPVSAAAEYGAEFRSDVEAYIPLELLEPVIVSGRKELLPATTLSHYFAFVDPSGGASDSMTLAISHHDKARDMAVLDCIREWVPPFNPDAVTMEACDLLRTYGIRQVEGDRYGGEWPRERFRAHGILYILSKKSRSDYYLDLLAPISAKRTELLDHTRLKAQLLGLDRRTARGGRDLIDHRPGFHDDIANAVAGAIVIADQIGGRRVGPEAAKEEPDSTAAILRNRIVDSIKKTVEFHQNARARDERDYDRPVAEPYRAWRG